MAPPSSTHAADATQATPGPNPATPNSAGPGQTSRQTASDQTGPAPAGPIRTGIVGATGYSGDELLGLLLGHTGVKIHALTSRSAHGKRVDEVHPHLRGRLDQVLSKPEPAALEGCDLVFFATPSATAMEMAPPLLERGMRVIDLSADFRLRDAASWQQWYGQPHASPQLLPQAVYGLPELNRDKLAGARLVAAPGCYPTAAILGLAPLLRAAVVDPERLIVNAVSGLSGAGRQLRTNLLLSEAAENVTAYAAGEHRHQPEITQALEEVAAAAATASAATAAATANPKTGTAVNTADPASTNPASTNPASTSPAANHTVSQTRQPVKLCFVPHLAPMSRGIHATIYAWRRPGGQRQSLQTLFEECYRHEPFVQVLPPGSYPATRHVRGSNQCQLAVHERDDGLIIVLAVLDNLVKGAAGQAVQCMNLMYGLEETRGLERPALLP